MFDSPPFRLFSPRARNGISAHAPNSATRNAFVMPSKRFSHLLYRHSYEFTFLHKRICFFFLHTFTRKDDFASANNAVNSKLYENESSNEILNDSQLNEQSSIATIQKPLIFMKLEMIKPSMEGASSINPEKDFSYIEEDTMTELPFLDITNNESIQNVTNIEEKIINSSKFTFSAKQTKEMSMKLTISCDATTTQAAIPYSSSVSTMASMVPTKDILQISTTPLSSIGSIPKSEILTITTDYNNRSPDVHSILVDVIDQHDPTSIFNRDLQLSIGEAFDLPRRSISSVRNNFVNRIRQSRRIWRLRKYLCCIATTDEETDTVPRLRGAPPTYSSIYVSPGTILRQESLIAQTNLHNIRRFIFSPTNQSSFVAPTPPPSYAQSQGIQLSPYFTEEDLSVSPSANSWSPRPIATICTRCLALVITLTEVRRSNIVHLSAFLLCLCGCWPCCMIPYCLNSCKNTDHYCPICHTYLGTYTPW
ncbi:uncharacterized protein LOC118451167 isoform X1 [Vespa mandarinia]|uniref:uncharacterized protein LOC118451167 isoform X1 n=2 Tax=Vespa mandarinia TaxID=7446 RepID=UPI0016164949|nr:uncharacterized protein LOC118451167 isoform X1 [Vespa mandarinia]